MKNWHAVVSGTSTCVCLLGVGLAHLAALVTLAL
jgi:hypothetical protein